MKGYLTLVMLSTLLIVSLSVALAENGSMTKSMAATSTMSTNMTENTTSPMNKTMPTNMPMCMTMPMNMSMKMPANGSSESTSVIVLKNVTLNVVLAQNLTVVTNTITLPSATNETKIAVSALKGSKPIALNKGS